MAAVTIKIKMECSEGSGYFYTTTKNPRNQPEKLQLMKYNPKLQRRVLFKEKKIK